MVITGNGGKRLSQYPGGADCCCHCGWDLILRVYWPNCDDQEPDWPGPYREPHRWEATGMQELPNRWDWEGADLGPDVHLTWAERVALCPGAEQPPGGPGLGVGAWDPLRAFDAGLDGYPNPAGWNYFSTPNCICWPGECNGGIPPTIPPAFLYGRNILQYYPYVGVIGPLCDGHYIGVPTDWWTYTTIWNRGHSRHGNSCPLFAGYCVSGVTSGEPDESTSAGARWDIVEIPPGEAITWKNIIPLVNPHAPATLSSAFVCIDYRRSVVENYIPSYCETSSSA